MNYSCWCLGIRALRMPGAVQDLGTQKEGASGPALSQLTIGNMGTQKGSSELLGWVPEEEMLCWTLENELACGQAGKGAKASRQRRNDRDLRWHATFGVC